VNDKTPTQQQKKTPRCSADSKYIALIEADILIAISGSQDLRLSKGRRALHDEDAVFYFNELIAVELHATSKATRGACAVIIDGHGFDRSRRPGVVRI
jgi:hypothetical protein